VRPLTEPEYDEEWDDEPIPVIPVRKGLQVWVRFILVMIALGICFVFAVAIWLDPYRDGRVWKDETHTQLGLPPCSFKAITGIPCPSCGMTTSFALFVRGDLWDSVQANFAGTFLAVLCFLYLPWTVGSLWRGKFLWIASVENTFLRLLIAFMALMLLRWVILLILRAMFPT
jgi:hypothetical protein